MVEISRRRLQLVTGILLSALLVFLVARVIDVEGLLAALAAADWRLLLLAVPFVLAYYWVIGRRFTFFSHLVGIELPARELSKLAIVSTAINRAVGFAGLAGYSLRVHYVVARGGRASAVLAASLINHSFKVVVMTIALPLLLITMLSVTGRTGLTEFTATVVLVAAVGAALFGLAQLVARPVPIHVTIPGTGVWARIKASWAGERVAQLRDAVGESVAVLLREPVRTLWPTLLIAGEVAAAMGVLFVAFVALGVTLTPLVLVAGYTIGFVSRFITIAPGGLGLQEASMAGAFSLMGLDLEAAVIAVVLFRALMDWLPCLVALVAARRMVGGAGLFRPLPADEHRAAA